MLPSKDSAPLWLLCSSCLLSSSVRKLRSRSSPGLTLSPGFPGRTEFCCTEAVDSCSGGFCSSSSSTKPDSCRKPRKDQLRVECFTWNSFILLHFISTTQLFVLTFSMSLLCFNTKQFFEVFRTNFNVQAAQNNKYSKRVESRIMTSRV